MIDEGKDFNKADNDKKNNKQTKHIKRKSYCQQEQNIIMTKNHQETNHTNEEQMNNHNSENSLKMNSLNKEAYESLKTKSDKQDTNFSFYPTKLISECNITENKNTIDSNINNSNNTSAINSNSNNKINHKDDLIINSNPKKINLFKYKIEFNKGDKLNKNKTNTNTNTNNSIEDENEGENNEKNRSTKENKDNNNIINNHYCVNLNINNFNEKNKQNMLNETSNSGISAIVINRDDISLHLDPEKTMSFKVKDNKAVNNNINVQTDNNDEVFQHARSTVFRDIVILVFLFLFITLIIFILLRYL